MKWMLRKPMLFSSLIVILYACTPSGNMNRIKQTRLSEPVFKNAHVGILVKELNSGKVLYAENAHKLFVPASNMKMLTTYAVLKSFPDSIPGIKYNIQDDTLFIQPTGDPTFLHPAFVHQKTFGFLSAQPYPLCIVIPPGEPVKYGTGWAWDDATENFMLERSFMPVYGNRVRVHFNNRIPEFFPASSSSSVTITDSNRLSYPSHFSEKEIAALLADTLHNTVSIKRGSSFEFHKQIYSAATDSVLKMMMWNSDNFLAEQLLIQVQQLRKEYNNDFPANSTLFREVLNIFQDSLRWVDGSGMSRYNLVSPSGLSNVIKNIIDEFGIERFKKLLPTGGQGTLKNYFRADSNFVYLKTGSMSNISSMSGIVQTKKGKWLIVVYMANNYLKDISSARKEMEWFIHDLRERL